MAESLNICVVDDDRDVAEGLAEILELAGHRVQTAFSGQDARHVLEQGSFDVAFLNAILPEQTRLESFIELRNANPDMQAVMMTGYTIEQLLRQAVQDGSVSVLQRPVAMDELLRALEAAKPQGIVLVAENDPEIRHKISETLALQDYRIGVARTVGDALDTVFANECDILVLDLRRPVIDALEVYLELEKHERALPTIVISEAPDAEGGPIDMLRDQSITGVLVKPFDPARLLAALGKTQKQTAAPVVEEPAAEPVLESHPANGHQGRILVIDDDRDLAEGLGEVLRDLGHTVEIAFNGSEALEIARRFDAQVALVDIKLGRASGLELISSLKELRPGIINVVITANAGKESVISALRSGAFDFLNKPMHPQDLFVILDRCFEHVLSQGQKAGASAESPSEFAVNASHELRDPLNAVIGFSEILGDEMMGPLGSDQYLHYAKGINEAGQHLTSVIDDIFETKGEGAQAPAKGEPLSQPAHAATDTSDDRQEPSTEPTPDASLADLPGSSGLQPSDMDLGGPDASLPEAQAPEPTVEPEFLEPAAPQLEPDWREQSAPPPYQSSPAQTNADAFSAESAPVQPRAADAAEFDAVPPVIEEPDPVAAARTTTDSAADHTDESQQLTEMVDAILEEARLFPPVSESPPEESADNAPDVAGQPWSSEAEARPFDLGHTEPKPPAVDWPEPGEASLVGSERRGLETPDAAAGPAVTADIPAVDSAAASSPPGHVEQVEQGSEDEEEHDPKQPHEDQEKKILRFSPFKKVI